MSAEEVAVKRVRALDLNDAALVMLSIGLLGIAVCNLITGDFAFQWQPVPTDIPERALVACVASVTLAAIVVLLMIQRGGKPLRWLAVYLGVWTIGLHGPVAIARPASIAAWLGVAEIGAPFLATCAVLVVSRDQAAVWARAFGLCPVIFGVAHFVYPEITANMVPAWIPFPTVWAYLTGVAHLAGGAAILTGLLNKLAAIALGGMYLSWALLLHLPRVVAAPGNRFEWTMLFIAIMISASAFLVSTVLHAKRRISAS